ncbi:thiamine pyrophosphate-dependent enzyme, partial [Bacillus mycoides]|uniref:thiamine pyrophosphate-dependent enzyme n=1 Tax=Bacillus mycoides TaxID=1405 RepID=UPI003CC7DBCB
MSENNKYPISIPLQKQLPSKNLSHPPIRYGIPPYTIHPNHPLPVYKPLKQPPHPTRPAQPPTLIQTLSYPLTPHSTHHHHPLYPHK